MSPAPDRVEKGREGTGSGDGPPPLGPVDEFGKAGAHRLLEHNWALLEAKAPVLRANLRTTGARRQVVV